MAIRADVGVAAVDFAFALLCFYQRRIRVLSGDRDRYSNPQFFYQEWYRLELERQVRSEGGQRKMGMR